MKHLYFKPLRLAVIIQALVLIGLASFGQTPTITSLSPAKGPIGTIVAINGSGFNASASSNMVFFGGVKASLTAANSTTLTAIVPPGSQNSPVTVINLSTGLQTNSSMAFYTTFTENGTNSFRLESFTSATIHDNNGGFGIWLSLSDVDNDGKIDLVIVNSFNQTINIYRNTAVSGILNSSSLTLSATFNVTPTYLTYTPRAVKMVDLDGDGKKDIVVPYMAQGKIGIYKNNTIPGSISRASFGGEIQLTVGSEPTWVDIADLDGDGKPEIVVANNLSSNITVLQNTGSKGNLTANSFAAKQNFPVGLIGSKPASVEIGDVDGDGKPDILVGTYSGFDIMRNTSATGVLSFTETQTNVGGLSSFRAYLIDLDGDAKYDVVLNNIEQNGVYIFRNSTPNSGAAMKFDGMVSLNTQSPIGYITFSDLNGDTHPEIITIPSNGYSTVFINNNQTGSLTAAAFGSELSLGVGGSYWASVASGDIDGDGKPDLINEDGNGTITLLRNNIAGVPQISGFTPSSAGPGSTITISGKNLTGTNKVSFGGTAATNITVQSATSLTAVLGRGTTGYVAVTNWEGRDSIAGFAYTGPPPPVITSFTPTSADIGTVLTITGTNFLNSNQPVIRIGGVYPQRIISETATTLVVVVDTGATGAITVSNIDGTASLGGFSFTPSPQINFLDKYSAAKGQTVTITGKYLTGTSSITLGGVPVASFTVVTPKTVRFIVGDGESGELVLKTQYGKATNSFTYISPPPSISSIGPMTAPAGATVQIAGSNFSVLPQNNIVYFGSVRGIVTQASTTQLSVTVPIGAFYAPISVTAHNYTLSTNKSFILTFAGGGTINAKTFGSRMDMFAGYNVSNFSVADINNDGLPDIMVPNHGYFNAGSRTNQSKKGQFKFLYNNAYSGSFGNNHGAPVDGVAADITHDGYMDYITVTDYGEVLNVNNVMGQYFSVQAFSRGYYTEKSMVVGDMNSDGQEEIMVSGPATGKTYVFDIDGDNKPDFVIAGTNSISIFLNTTAAGTASPTYAPMVNIPLSAPSSSLAIGDFDGDGKPDIAALSAVYSGTTGDLSVYKNTGAAGTVAFSKVLSFPVQQDAYKGAYCALGDVDGDGKIELIYSGKGSVSVFKNTSVTGVIAFAPRVDYAADGSLYLTVADFDGDGQPDIAGLGSTNYGNEIFVLRNLTGTIPVTDIKPAYGPVNTMISITGSGFTGVTGVSLGGYKLKNFSVVSANTITAVVDTTVSGYASITTNGNTATSLTKYYTADAPPVISPKDTIAIFAGDSVLLSSSQKFGYYPDMDYETPYLGSYNSGCQWSKDGLDILFAKSQTFKVSQAGSYTLSLSIMPSGRITSKPVVVILLQKLPVNNFLISVTNASCKGSSTGAIQISATYAVNSTVVITGSGYNFTGKFNNQVMVDKLAAGTYNLCINIDGHPDMQQCYTLNISEPKDISLFSTISQDNKNLTLNIGGGRIYNIQLNGVLLTTTDSTITLPLGPGKNILTVTTDKPCQGVVQKTIIASDIIIPYPNPFEGKLYLNIGHQKTSKALVEIFNAMGVLIYKNRFVNPENTIELDLSSIKMTGAYHIKLTTDNGQQVFKVIRK